MKTTSVMISLLLFAFGCATSPRHEADRGLEGTLRSQLDERHVHVDVHHGVVKLEGKVRTEAEREQIESLVRSTPGVVAVKDKLKVSFASPGQFGAVRSTIPVYTTPPPYLSPAGRVETLPAPVVIPDYPKLRVQAWTAADESIANSIAEQLRTEQLPTPGSKDVTITVRNGTVSLEGVVDSGAEREALISAVERAGGVRAIYDQLHIR